MNLKIDNKGAEEIASFQKRGYTRSALDILVTDLLTDRATMLARITELESAVTEARYIFDPDAIYPSGHTYMCTCYKVHESSERQSIIEIAMHIERDSLCMSCLDSSKIIDEIRA